MTQQVEELNSTISDFFLENCDIVTMTHRIKALKLTMDKNEFNVILHKAHGRIDSVSYIIKHLDNLID